MLTERRKADRAELARQVAALARDHGITAEIRDEQSGTREASVVLSAPHTLALTVTFRGNSPHSEPDTYVLSWHMRPWSNAGRDWQLTPAFSPGVSTHHGTKATDTVHGSGPLLRLLARRFHAIADGSAFTYSRTDCEFCRARNIRYVAVLTADPDQRVCEGCHADPRLPTTAL